jgi:hypothetical protein
MSRPVRFPNSAVSADFHAGGWTQLRFGVPRVLRGWCGELGGAWPGLVVQFLPLPRILSSACCVSSMARSIASGVATGQLTW